VGKMIKKLDEYIDGMYSYVTSLDDLKFYQNDENIGGMLNHITRTAALCILLDLHEIVMKQMRTVQDEDEAYDMIKYQTMYISGTTLIEHLRDYANSINSGDSLDTYYQLVTSISDDIQQTKYISDLTGLCMRTISLLERTVGNECNV
jgi:hypothetical protein